MNFGFRISDFGFASHPSGSEPPRHQCKFGIRNSEFGIPTQPSLSQRRDAEAQRRRGSCRRLHRTARSRPSDDGRPPLGQKTAPKTSFRSSFLAQRPALSERRPRHFSFLFNSWEKYTSLPIKEEVRQNRRATGASTGEKTGRNGCLYPKRSGFSPATGDRPIACRSAANKRHHHPGSATAPWCLGVLVVATWMGGWIWVYLCDLWANLGGCAALRLCDSAPLRFLLCDPLCASVSLWFFSRRISRSA